MATVAGVLRGLEAGVWTSEEAFSPFGARGTAVDSLQSY